jgi:ABC-type lipoprotein export system ATPase subunit
MQATGQIETRYFPSYESRETALGRSVGHLIPHRHNGPRRFWRDFKLIAGSGLPVAVLENIAYISADPRDTLAFGSALQVLTAACMGAATGCSPRQLAAEMEIETLLHQPIRTLSGGESVKLALAKSLAVSAASSKLVVSSPFSWLSRVNRALFDRVLDAYHHQRVPVEILALEGEDDPAPIRADTFWEGRAEKPLFSLSFSGARIALGSPLNAVTDEQLRARVADFSGRLVSPCLFEGGNGQGKSLLAKSLAGAIATRGEAVIESAHATGRARLLFQDVITQTLLRSFDAITHSVKTGRRGQTVKLYQHLCRAFEAQAGESGDCFAGREPERAVGPRTLLEIKMILIAVRLAESPPALILDEPDWGLSRQAAISLVAAVIGVAHAQGVPVILISHKPWWQSIAGSMLKVEKFRQDDGGCPFEIRLQQM